jgi:hypothetical protein
MDGGRITKLLLVCGLAIFTIVIGSRSFLNYRPPVPGEPSLGEATTNEPANQSASQSRRNSDDENDLVQDRIRRMQAVIRSQRSELSSLREKPARPKTEKKTKEATKSGSLLSRLPDLSVFGVSGTKELTKEELADRLERLREVSVELRDQLESAEMVVEMQSSEIDELQEEVELTRDRLDALTEERIEADDVLDEMMAESRDIERVARGILVELGPPAVAMLLTLSDDNRAHVRQWVRDVITQSTEAEDPNREP